jgi:iron complex transport system substrate-binding protein
MPQHRIRTAELLVLISIVLVSGACSTKPTATPALPPTATASTPTQVPLSPTLTAVPAAGVISVTDAAGQTIELEQPPERLVLVGRGPYMGLHLLYMFPTAWDKLVGLEKKGTTADDFLPFVDPNWDKKTVLGSGPNAEQIAALKPDLVLMKGIVPDSLSKALAQVNIPTLYVNLETPDAFYQDVTNLGLVLGAESRAQEIIAYYKGKLDRIQQRIAGLTESEKPRALLLEYTDRGGAIAVNVPAKAWMQTLEVQSAGGNPVWLEAAAATDGWTVTNLEQIALWNPDKIFLVIWYTLNPIDVIDMIKADPLWSQLKAVKNNEVYAFPSDLYGWDSPEPRWILGVTWLATRMYPDKFADIDMNEEIREFFTTFYGMDRATIDREIVTRAHMDVH